MRWFKFYGQDWLTDLKIRKLRLEDRMCFITLLCLASTADEGGLVRNCDETTLIELSNLRDNPYNDDNEYTRAIGCLERYKALQIVTLHHNGDVTVNNFGRRQGENLSNAERQKKYREGLKTKAKSRNARNVTRYNDSNARIEENRIEENRIDTIQVSVSKNKYGEFSNVLLSSEEYQKLINQYSETPTQALIEELSNYMASTGKRYKNHYATLLNWARRKISEHVGKIKSNPVAF